MGIKYLKTKRCLDIVFSILILPVILPLIGILCFVVWVDDGRPVIFSSKRIGKGYKVFSMLKLRTMKKNSPVIYGTDGSAIATTDDIRFTRTGKILRETSLDELPQIFNVLKGEMSLIGPRASLVEALGTFKKTKKRR